MFATVAAVGFLGAYIVVPTGAALAEASAEDTSVTTLYAAAQSDAQSLVVDIAGETSAPELSRGSYQVYVKPKPKPVVPAAAASTKAASGWEASTVVAVRTPRLALRRVSSSFTGRASIRPSPVTAE